MTDNDADSNAPPAATSPRGASLSLDTVFELLANRRRRFALYALSDAADGMADIGVLIEDVATLEAALDGTALTREGYLEVGTDLYEWHVPVLVDVGVVECDARHGTIRYWSHPALETWMERARAAEVLKD